MLALARLVVICFVVMTVVYVALSLWSRSVRKRKLAREWDEEIREGDRDAFIDDGLEAYSHSLRRRLILLVYIIPVIVIGLIVYLVNFY
ncbi:hypothetical protein [Thalassovita aquimarina]|uniref:Cation/multidrug efflux pump n=1 Tax=Thalassovita aquimarina TaxID=2785917 RepID=A0ABS5HMG5_9RHOB|nr:hypothetical protein [Thalassovita aquimarina]MBR9650114.1 hypothetical protein [Thalassovita aquimarina]